MHISNQLIRNLQLFCCLEQFILPHGSQSCDLLVHFTHMTDCLYHITCTGLALCTDHGSPFIDSAECFSQILCTAYKRYFELCLVNMVHIIRR